MVILFNIPYLIFLVLFEFQIMSGAYDPAIQTPFLDNRLAARRSASGVVGMGADD
jgi:hypothetical protein